jgi:hypothetical protein
MCFPRPKVPKDPPPVIFSAAQFYLYLQIFALHRFSFFSSVFRITVNLPRRRRWRWLAYDRAYPAIFTLALTRRIEEFLGTKAFMPVLLLRVVHPARSRGDRWATDSTRMSSGRLHGSFQLLAKTETQLGPAST